MSFVFKCYAISDLGLVRDGNEDSGLLSPQLIAVADGMGGHAGGEVASTIAIKALQDRQKLAGPVNEVLVSMTTIIDNAISLKVRQSPEFSGMGTTLTALLINGENIELLHVGDSRCYAFTNNKLTQLSTDHTVMQELIDQGRLSRDEVASHPQRSLLTQALMGDSGIEALVKIYPAKVGDQFLLCSDGLSSVLSDLEIEKALKKFYGKELVENLLTETKVKGAPDNVTIIWAEVVAENADGNSELIGAANG